MEILQNFISKHYQFKNPLNINFTHHETAIPNFFPWRYQLDKQNDRIKDKSSDNDWLPARGSQKLTFLVSHIHDFSVLQNTLLPQIGWGSQNSSIQSSSSLFKSL